MGARWADIMGAFPPGKLIREELDARGWTQKELADRMERPVQIDQPRKFDLYRDVLKIEPSRRGGPPGP
jgi:transcriptional regulator with XRE-family HTH domain